MAGRRRRRIVGWGALLVVVLAVLVAIVVFGRLDGPTAAEREVGEALALASREVNEFHPAPGAGAVERPAIEDADLYRCGRSDSGWEPRAEVFYSGTDRPELVSELRSFLEVRGWVPTEEGLGPGADAWTKAFGENSVPVVIVATDDPNGSASRTYAQLYLGWAVCGDT